MHFVHNYRMSVSDLLLKSDNSECEILLQLALFDFYRVLFPNSHYDHSKLSYDGYLQYNMLLYTIDGKLVSSYSAYDFALGIKSVTWSPSSQFLVIGSYDQSVSLFLIIHIVLPRSIMVMKK